MDIAKANSHPFRVPSTVQTRLNLRLNSRKQRCRVVVLAFRNAEDGVMLPMDAYRVGCADTIWGIASSASRCSRQCCSQFEFLLPLEWF